MSEHYCDDPDYVNDDDEGVELAELIVRCEWTYVAYCIAGGHYLIVYGDEVFCPIGCGG